MSRRRIITLGICIAVLSGACIPTFYNSKRIALKARAELLIYESNKWEIMLSGEDHRGGRWYLWKKRSGGFSRRVIRSFSNDSNPVENPLFPESSSELPLLSALLKSNSRNAKRMAIQSLKKTDPNSTEAIELLEKHRAQESDRELQNDCADAINFLRGIQPDDPQLRKK